MCDCRSTGCVAAALTVMHCAETVPQLMLLLAAAVEQLLKRREGCLSGAPIWWHSRHCNRLRWHLVCYLPALLGSLQRTVVAPTTMTVYEYMSRHLNRKHKSKSTHISVDLPLLVSLPSCTYTLGTLTHQALPTGRLSCIFSAPSLLQNVW